MLGLTLLGLAWPAFAGDARQSAAEADWHRSDALPASLARRLPSFCAGRYLEPDFPLPRDADSRDQDIHARAERMDYEVGSWASFDGGVTLTQGNLTLEAASARVHELTEQAEAQGGIRLRLPGLLVHGERGEFSLATGAGGADDVSFLLHDNAMRGAAARLSLDEAGNLRIQRAAMTRCEPGHDGWALTGRDIRIDAGEPFGTIRHATLQVYGVPVLYSPYISFPVTDERMSGFLLPDLGFSSDEGLDIRVPYYFNLAPNYDATLAARSIARRGAGFDVELRHLSPTSETELGGAWLYRDSRFDGRYDKDDFDDLEIPGRFEPADRWLVSVDHQQRLGAVDLLVDYAAVSDGDYFRDLGTDLSVTSRRQIERRGEVRYQADGLTTRLWAQDFQQLDPERREAYQRLPELELSYFRRLGGTLLPDWATGLSGSVYSSWSRFERDNTGLSGVNQINGDRLHIEPRLRLPLEAMYGFLRTEVGYRYTAYDLTDLPEGFERRPERGVALASVDSGLYFDRPVTLLGADWNQTLEPRLYYLYQEFEEQSQLPRFDASELTFSFAQLFRDNRFAGVDRIGDANQLSAAVTTRFQRDDTGHERFRASIGRIFFFDDRRVTLSGSPGTEAERAASAWAAETRLALGSHWQLRGGLIWNPYDDELAESSVQLQYRGDRHQQGDGQRLFNVGYRNRVDASPEIRQSEISVLWPLASHWSVLGYWNYDFEFNRTIEGFGGLEYNDCCWQVRVVGRRSLRIPNERQPELASNQRGVYVQVVFRGMGGVGGRVEPIMENGIRGYRRQQ